MAPINMLFERVNVTEAAITFEQLLQLPESTLAQIPALAPPPGVTSNFVNPASIGGILLAFSCVGIVILVICTSIRAWVLWSVHPFKWAWSDVAFGLTILVSLAMYTIFILTVTSVGQNGVHQWDAPLSKMFNPRYLIPSNMTAIAIIASILSVVYRVKLNNATDLTWNLIPLFSVHITELFLGTIIACTPHIARFLRHYHKFFSKFGSILGFWLCCCCISMRELETRDSHRKRYGSRSWRSHSGSGKSSKASGSSASTSDKHKKHEKLYPALDFSSVGGTMGPSLGGTMGPSLGGTMAGGRIENTNVDVETGNRDAENERAKGQQGTDQQIEEEHEVEEENVKQRGEDIHRAERHRRIQEIYCDELE
ncbi:hypothetical protein NHQ30_009193 [Ciborinia camelliae]|nr:hypothetical protein NHQ30_009193 [Ciborinia camelliae]